MLVDYLNFNYGDKEKVKEVVSEIHMEIDKYLYNPIIGYNTGVLVSDGLSSNRRILKGDVAEQNQPEYMIQLLDALHVVEQHLKPLGPEFEFLGIKKYSESKKESDMYDELAKKNGLFAKTKLEEVKAYLAFSLSVISDLDQEKNNLDIISTPPDELNRKVEEINNEILKMRAITENLEEIRYRLEKIKQDLFDFRGLQDDQPERIVTEISVQHDILEAKSIIEKFKEKLTPKEKRQNIYDACNSKFALQSDSEIIANLIKRLRVIRDERFESNEHLENVKVSDFINKIHNASLVASSVAMIQFVNEERMGKMYEAFFGYNNYSLDEQILRLELLNVSVIATQQDLQDYLTSGNKEVEITRTKNGKLNIKISQKISYDTEYEMTENSSKETSFLNNKAEITYVYDMHKRELEVVSYKDNASVYDVDIKSELGKNVKSQFNGFLGALEGSLNVQQKDLLGLRVNMPQNFNVLLKGLGVKEKLEIKSSKNKNITVKTEIEATAGELGYTKRRGPKGKIINISGKAALESKDAKLEAKINSYIDNPELDLKTRMTFGDIVLAIQEGKFSALFGTQLTAKGGLVFNKEDKTINDAGFIKDIRDNVKGAYNTVVALFYAYILKDDAKASQLLGLDTVEKVDFSDILKKSMEILKNVKYMKKDKEAYDIEKQQKEFQEVQTRKTGHIVEDAINKFGKPKEEKVDTITSKSIIKGTDVLDERTLKEHDIRTVDNELSKIINTIVLNEDLKRIRELFVEVGNPLKYFDTIDRIQAENDDTRNSVINIFNKVSKDYISKLLEEQDTDKLKEILSNPKYKELSIEVFKKADKEKVVKLFEKISSEINPTIDEIIKSNKAAAKKIQKDANSRNAQDVEVR